MSEKNLENKNSQHQSKQKLTASFLVLAGFASLATHSGLISQIAKNLDQYLIPVAEAKTLATEQIVISEQQLIEELGADTLKIDGKTVYLNNQAGEKKVAPDGYYKLSNGLIIKVKDGQIASQATLQPGTDQKISRRSDWRETTWGQAAKPDPDKQIAIQLSNSNVQDTLNQIINS